MGASVNVGERDTRAVASVEEEAEPDRTERHARHEHVWRKESRGDGREQVVGRAERQERRVTVVVSRRGENAFGWSLGA
jgi:hypothetical protein